MCGLSGPGARKLRSACRSFTPHPRGRGRAGASPNRRRPSPRLPAQGPSSLGRARAPRGRVFQPGRLLPVPAQAGARRTRLLPRLPPRSVAPTRTRAEGFLWEGGRLHPRCNDGLEEEEEDGPSSPGGGWTRGGDGPEENEITESSRVHLHLKASVMVLRFTDGLNPTWPCSRLRRLSTGPGRMLAPGGSLYGSIYAQGIQPIMCNNCVW